MGDSHTTLAPWFTAGFVPHVELAFLVFSTAMLQRCGRISKPLIRHVLSQCPVQVPRLVLLKREIDILRTVDHPMLIRLEDVYEDDINLHLVRLSRVEFPLDQSLTVQKFLDFAAISGVKG